jgi:hypothetical protein
VLTRRTFVSHFCSSRAPVIVIAGRRVSESAAFKVAIEMRTPVRPAYWR